ncbi:MAG: hypothetical protein ABIA12_02585 [Candidatus Aenigmatarchaeota archaeon]
MPITLSLKKHFIRDLKSENLLEVFMVTAVASVLTIRFLLALTGYPQFGVAGLRITHVLFGGMMMMVSIVIFLSFVNRTSRKWAAAIGGMGFGAFVDEMGKFVTSDANYFFQPAVGMIYVTFILVYFLSRRLNSESPLTPAERVANVLEISKEAMIRGLNSVDRKMVSELLATFGRHDGTSGHLRAFLKSIQAPPRPKLDAYERLRVWTRSIYMRIVRGRVFNSIVVAFFLMYATGSLLVSLDTIVGMRNAILLTVTSVSFIGTVLSFRSNRREPGRLIYAVALAASLAATYASFSLEAVPSISVADWMQIGFNVLAGALVLVGLLYLRRDRIVAYGYFKNAVLVHVFFVQLFIFFKVQFLGLLGLGFNLLTLAVLRYIMSNEAGRIESRLRPRKRHA